MKPELLTPAVAGRVFGDRLPLAERYVAHLATTGVEWGLIGPREIPRLWERHVLNCAVVAELIPAGATVIDVGSGAGLPGLPIALARRDLHVTLVEPLERRCTWLTQVIEDLGLPVVVDRTRAEDAAGRLQAQVVTARAVAALDRLVRWLAPLVQDGGTILAMKGRTAPEEVQKARPVLRRLKFGTVDILECGRDVVAEPTTVVRLRS